MQWQTSVPDQPALTGWGGRCADMLNSVNTNAPISLSVSLAGANTLEVGNIVSEYSVSTSGAIALSGVSGARLSALTNILACRIRTCRRRPMRVWRRTQSIRARY